MRRNSFGVPKDKTTAQEKSKRISKYHCWATKLITALRTNGKIMRLPSRDKWAQDFRKFHESMDMLYPDTQTEHRIEHVLGWFCHNLSGTYIPKVRSAASFCERFVQVEDAMETALGEVEQYVPSYNDIERDINDEDGFRIGIAYYDKDTGKVKAINFWGEAASVPSDLKDWK